MIVDATTFGLSSSALSTVNDAAIQAAAASIVSTGGVVYIPSGVYDIGAINLPMQGVEIHGAARKATTLRSVIPVGDVVSLPGWDTAVRRLSIVSDDFRASGANVYLGGHRAVVDDVFINKDVLGIKMTGVAASILNTFLHTGKGGGARILVGGGDASQVIDNVLIGAQDGSQPNAGIQCYDTIALTISNTRVLNAGYGLLIAPQSGQLVASIIARDCYFDTGKKGVFINASQGGHVSRVSIRGCWAGNSQEDGIAIVGGSPGTCLGVSIEGCDIIKNAFSSGVSLFNVSGVSISGSKIAGNIHGVWVGGGCSNFSIVGNQIGEGAGETPNTGLGVRLDPYADRYQICNNNMIANGSGKISGFSPSAYRVESGNIG